MLRASISFFVIGLLAMAVGAQGMGGVSLELGRLLLFVFLALSILSLLASVTSKRSYRNMGVPMLAMTLALLGANGATPSISAHADETVPEKVQNTAGDLKTDAKKGLRKGKRKVRKATGDDSVLKDAKDGLNDAGDDVSNTAKKTKRKVD